MKFSFIPLVIILLFTIPAEAQLFKKNKKQDSLKSGRIIEYGGDDSTTIVTRGRFKNGRPCKTWKYYWDDGTMRMKIKYHDRLKIKYYTTSGRLDQKGYAMLDFNAADTHFYWHGRWKYYDDRRKLYRIALYQDGAEVEVLKGPEDPIFYE